MTTSTSRTSSDAALASSFSYAQAAKGLSAAPGSSASKASSSGAATPAKDPQQANTSAAAVMSWAEDAESNGPRSEKSAATRESRQHSTKSAAVPSELTAAALSSPEMGASTASTVTKDDDVSSVPNTSSDSTWENKSQASNPVDKSTEPSEKSSRKGKGKKQEQAPAKPLQEAPLPSVNIWQQRAELRKPAKPTAASALPSGPAPGSSSAAKQSKDTESVDVNGKVASTEAKPRGVEEDKAPSVRQESKTETDTDKARKSTRARPQETRETAASFSLPLDRDQESWPTMGDAIDGDRKKAQEKTEKSGRERQESMGSKTGKWVKVPFVPTVAFSTPMPSNGARRGGRGGARGGAQAGGRAGFGSEKDTSAVMSNGDQARRGRSDMPIRETSPKGKRTASAGSLATKDKSTQLNGEKLAMSAEFEPQSRGIAALQDSSNNVSGSGPHNTFPRPSNRPNKGRKGDWRKDGDSASPTKENGVSADRVTSATQTDAPEDAERRNNHYGEGQAPHQSKRGSSDRFGYNGRERRGGGRGGRGGNFSNGHQFGNGHMSSMKPSSGYPMSPTSFNPENQFFPQGNSRFGRQPRSQSVTNDNMYRYGGPQQMAPINTYMPNGAYEYPGLPQPMSAVPFNQYGLDHLALFSMVTTQLEYYFSLDNLCKDMFLRKHMDSKGFVFLNVISDFNRIKHLTPDLELVKLVCYQSRMIEFRVGHDGKDRLRAREGWEQWVLPIAERDPSAQNEGPEELYNPPIPHPTGFDPNGNPTYPNMSASSPSAPAAYGNDGTYPTMNGFHPGAPQHAPVLPTEGLPNGVAAEPVNGNEIPNGHPVDDATKAVSGEPDLFSDEEVEALTIIVRKQDHFQMPVLPLSASCSFSNTSHSRRDMVDESEERVGRRAHRQLDGDGPVSRVESQVNRSRGTPSPFPSTSSTACSQYWVKDNDAPLDAAPPGCFHESYAVLRLKALHERRQSVSGGCSYDMSVLYQFWSHFLVRNFNTQMYDEFHLFALEDFREKWSDVGLSSLLKFYGELLLSSQTVLRDRIARDIVDLVQSGCRPAFQQLRSALHNDNMNARNRIRISDLLDDELKASLE